LILATSKDQIQYLDGLHASLQHPILNSPTHSPLTGLGVPTYFLGPNDATDLEPDLGPNVLAAMLSTESGIVDSHGLMESLETEINGGLPGQRAEGNGSVVLGTRVVRIDPYRDETGGTSSLLPVNAHTDLHVIT
jgi:L-2-hydroxyglutarate oxidase LhgO